MDNLNHNCTVYDENYCAVTLHYLVKYSTKNAEGIWESGLQCPGCGCDDDGAINLNDLNH